jgi:hypothetical protein
MGKSRRRRGGMLSVPQQSTVAQPVPQTPAVVKPENLPKQNETDLARAQSELTKANDELTKAKAETPLNEKTVETAQEKVKSAQAKVDSLKPKSLLGIGILGLGGGYRRRKSRRKSKRKSRKSIRRKKRFV